MDMDIDFRHISVARSVDALQEQFPTGTEFQAFCTWVFVEVFREFPNPLPVTVDDNENRERIEAFCGELFGRYVYKLKPEGSKDCQIIFYAGNYRDDFSFAEAYEAFCEWLRREFAREFRSCTYTVSGLEAPWDFSINVDGSEGERISEFCHKVIEHAQHELYMH